MIHAQHQSNILISYDFQLSSLSILNSQGDCDEDTECGPGLICFQREGSEIVPGCSGEDNTDWDRKDFCVTKCNEDQCVLQSIGNNINPGFGNYKKCEVSRIKYRHMILYFLNCPFTTIFTNY